MRTLAALATLSGAARAIFALLLLLTCIRLAMLGVEVALLPLVPYDAFAQWATKSRVWYEYGRMVPFVGAAEWGRAAAGALQFTDTHPEYPGTVPLFQVWTALCLGRWDESLVNVGWVAACVSLGIAFYAQLRRARIRPGEGDVRHVRAAVAAVPDDPRGARGHRGHLRGDRLRARRHRDVAMGDTRASGAMPGSRS